MSKLGNINGSCINKDFDEKLYCSPDVLVKTYQMIQAIKKMHYEPFPVEQPQDIKFTK